MLMSLIHAVQVYFLTKIYENAGKPNKVTLLLLLLFRERDFASMYLQDDSVMSVFIVIGAYYIQKS